MNRTINFMGVRNIAFAFTVLLTLLALGSLFTKGLNLGLDFTGGTQIELSYEQPADLGNIREQLAGAGYADAVVQSFGATTDVVVRMQGDDPELGNKVAAALRQASPFAGVLSNAERLAFLKAWRGRQGDAAR